MKWNAFDIIEFLNIYERYPILWNIKEKEYNSKEKREEMFKNLLNELNKKNLTIGMDVKQLKAKIKSIKDVYRLEINKIEKSRKNAIDELYTPKLAWFNSANYLADAVNTRNTRSNCEMSQSRQNSLLPDEDNTITSIEFKKEYESSDDEECNNEEMEPSSMQKKGCKKRRASQEITNSTEILQAIEKICKFAKDASDDKPYELFGKLVASELRALPERPALLLQQEIFNCIYRYRLATLE